MTKLTDTQLLILSKAAQRDDHAVEPPSELKGAAAQKVVRKLIKDGLLAEAAGGPDLPVWRREEDGRPVSLLITAAGLDAIGIAPEDREEGSEPEAPPIARDAVVSPEHKRLVVNEEEAERVRMIFRQYLELGCLTKLAGDLRERGIVTKAMMLSSGSVRGGIPFTKGPLHYLLRNRVYVGEIVHKGQYFPGGHEPIIDRELFDAVQQALASRANARTHSRINDASLLIGRVFDDRENRMTPSTANKGGMRYRYYISAPLLQGRKEDAGLVSPVSAPDLEAAVAGALPYLWSSPMAGLALLQTLRLTPDRPSDIAPKQLHRHAAWR